MAVRPINPTALVPEFEAKYAGVGISKHKHEIFTRSVHTPIALASGSTAAARHRGTIPRNSGKWGFLL